MDEIDYEQLGELLEAAGVDLIPAEFHGQLTGLWCRRTELPRDLGLSDVNPESCTLEPLRDFATALWRQLEDPAGSFDLMLPADDASLTQRVDALAEWCDGMLYGIGHAGQLDVEEYGEEVGEALRDLAEISNIELAPSGGEDDESAYAEIVEYLRVVAQTLYIELRPRPSGGENEH